MRNLLIRLGLIKIDQAEYFEILEKLHNNLSTNILKEKQLEGNDYNMATCEIKIFFWVLAGQILKDNMPSELFDRTMKFFRSNIIFSTIDEFKYTDDVMINFLQSRIEFHQHGIDEGVKSSANNYFQQLNILWFKEPFSDIENLKKNNMLDLDFFGKNKLQIETQSLYINLVPVYTKRLMTLIKATRK